MKLIVEAGFESREATLSDLRKALVEYGMVAVPENGPSAAMEHAFFNNKNDSNYRLKYDPHYNKYHAFCDDYKAMIRAAQEDE